jgi:hypothetical protein
MAIEFYFIVAVLSKARNTMYNMINFGTSLIVLKFCVST